jgi:hypothetical protein
MFFAYLTPFVFVISVAPFIEIRSLRPAPYKRYNAPRSPKSSAHSRMNAITFAMC